MVTSIKGAFLSPTGPECKVLNDAQRAYHATTFLLKNYCTVKKRPCKSYSTTWIRVNDDTT